MDDSSEREQDLTSDPATLDPSPDGGWIPPCELENSNDWAPPSDQPGNQWNFGTEPGYASQHDAWGVATAETPPQRKSRFRIIIPTICAALIAGGSSGAIAALVESHSTARSAVVTKTIVPKGRTISANSSESIQQIITQVEPAVVSITATSTVQTGFNGFGIFGSGGGTATQTDEGTGMIITSTGEVVTNNHVISGATSISVNLGGSTSYTATVLGADPSADVALLQIHGAGNSLPTVSFGNSSVLQVGDSVIAIGNALALTGGFTVTSGIVSALNRSLTAQDSSGTTTESLSGLIQTDAPINSGNSGGPLVNSSGQVIGMNTAVASSSAGNAATQGIGFAIPSSQIESLLNQLRKGSASSA